MKKRAGFTDISQEQNLISLVHERPVLWNKTHPQHKNSYKLGESWDQVVDALDIGKTAVKNKWKSLVKRFKAEVKENKGGQSGSAAAGNGSNWPHFKSLSFLLDSIRPNVSTGNLDNLLAGCNKYENSSDSDSDTSHYQANQENFDALVQKVQSDMNPSSKKASKASKADQILKIENEKMALLRDVLKEKNDNKDTDDTDDMLYFKTLGRYIRMIDAQDRLALRREISDLVEKYAYKDTSVSATVTVEQPQQQKRTVTVTSTPRKPKKKAKYDSDSDVEIISVNLPDEEPKNKTIKKEKKPFESNLNLQTSSPQMKNSIGAYKHTAYAPPYIPMGNYNVSYSLEPDSYISEALQPRYPFLPPQYATAQLGYMMQGLGYNNLVTGYPPQIPQEYSPQATFFHDQQNSVHAPLDSSMSNDSETRSMGEEDGIPNLSNNGTEN